jgi:hypothetical protein
MPPEKSASLIAVDFRLENGKLIGWGERIYKKNDPPLYASWYANERGIGQFVTDLYMCANLI